MPYLRVPMLNRYRGYKGEIKPSDKGGYEVYGIAEKIDDTTVSITELAIRKSLQTGRGLSAAVR